MRADYPDIVLSAEAVNPAENFKLRSEMP